MKKPHSVKKLLKSDSPLVIPGVYDAIGAKIVETVGFDAMFQTGFGTSATFFGMPDYGFVGARETIENARRICNSTTLPVIVDSDTGYGNALSVWKLVTELEDAGAAGIFLEDQKWPKRCGHMQGKEVVPQEEYMEKLNAVLDARKSRDFIVVARTDSLYTEGIDSAIDRAKKYKKAGADVLFVEAPNTKDQLKKIGKAINAPLVANMIEGGVTPLFSSDELYSYGYNIILYPLSILFASTYASLRVLKELKRKGTTKSLADAMVSFDEFNDMVGLEGLKRLEKKYQR